MGTGDRLVGSYLFFLAHSTNPNKEFFKACYTFFNWFQKMGGLKFEKTSATLESLTDDETLADEEVKHRFSEYNNAEV